jgi:GTP cyclohydrolase I
MNIEKQIKEMLLAWGEDPSREGLRKTPSRVSESYEYLLSGYGKDVKDEINNAFYEDDCTGMIIIKDIEFYSICEHHLLPFYGRCHVGYIPRKKIIGISKIPRIVDIFARRLQVQERLTEQISSTLKNLLDPMGVAVVMRARHLCMMMRGVEKQNSVMMTSSVLGAFEKNASTRDEFFKQISF